MESLPDQERPGWTAPQSFVKFFGSSSDIASRIRTTLSVVQRTGNHAVCAFPAGKRPRQVQDGAVIFTGRLVEDPRDTMIYGRAIAKRHEAGAAMLPKPTSVSADGGEGFRTTSAYTAPSSWGERWRRACR
jgi:hypothetical protein